MKILFAASEGVPFCKTGGLADVIGALPDALAAKRHSVRTILPLYRQVREQHPEIRSTGRTTTVTFDGQKWPVKIWEAEVRSGLKALFIDAPEFFDRAGIYGPQPGTGYSDNDRRYAFYSRAIFAVAKAMDFKADILHGHDWQAGLAMAYLKLIYSADPFFAKTASVFTIHNLAYQGDFPAPSFHMTGLPPETFSPQGVEFYGKVSFLKAGLVYADALNTVSPTYAKEISSDPILGCGMEGIFQERAADFTGILNGLDVAFWDPKTDSNLAQKFDKESIDKRAANKADLQKQAGLSVNPAMPLLAFIGRLDYQKGIDLLVEIVPTLLKTGAQFLSLGQGNAQYTKDLLEIERRFPAQVHVKSDFAEAFAHKIYAGADIFLMPSRYEPCGLGQMIAMRYGAIPVVTPTGGLLDTVKDNLDGGQGTGFVAEHVNAGSFLSALRTAVDQWKEKGYWRAMQERAMRQDFAWRNSVRDYLVLYESVLK